MNYLKNLIDSYNTSGDNDLSIRESDILMIIDMQRFFLNYVSDEDLRTKIPYQEEIIQKANKKDTQTIFIEWLGKEPTIPQLKHQAINQITRKKKDNSAFKRTRLKNLLDSLNPRYIHVMGCYAESCVFDTIKDAIYRDFRIIAHTQGILPKDTSKAEVLEAKLYPHYLNSKERMSLSLQTYRALGVKLI